MGQAARYQEMLRRLAIVDEGFAGSGPSPYSLVLLGDDMLRFEREEYDPERGTWQEPAPGDAGRPNR